MSMQYAQPFSCEGANAHELAQPGIEVDPVQLLGGRSVQLAERAREAGGVGVEVQPDRDRRRGLWRGVGGRHDSEPSLQPARG
jgi:hypothetical protein